MFTGIIEEKGTIKDRQLVSEQAMLITIEASQILDDMQMGDSIAVNGICLTVTAFSETYFQVDIMPETLKTASLKLLTEGSSVNLERSMPANGRFGGHFVSGHADGSGTITRKETRENAVNVAVDVPDELAVYLIEKGSVAVDGVSLTVFGISGRTMTLSLIPHTVSATVLGDKQKGDPVTIECDILAKYMKNMLSEQH
ncbi:riboflavin synthase subunit alpha [Barrientosiimonas marina]|uniref:Riboflavin synthase n=1 Tax=Lentibacillus kimchii TaxID=1542911 RepID=A0ABW2UTU0_9BACI